LPNAVRVVPGRVREAGGVDMLDGGLLICGTVGIIAAEKRILVERSMSSIGQLFVTTLLCASSDVLSNLVCGSSGCCVLAR
jgi:hypothetical protein